MLKAATFTTAQMKPMIKYSASCIGRGWRMNWPSITLRSQSCNTTRIGARAPPIVDPPHRQENENFCRNPEGKVAALLSASLRAASRGLCELPRRAARRSFRQYGDGFCGLLFHSGADGQGARPRGAHRVARDFVPRVHPLATREGRFRRMRGFSATHMNDRQNYYARLQRP
jgi:hypothetical protein